MNDPWIRRVWERKGLLGNALWFLLLPLSLIYFVAVQTRSWLYSRGWIRTKSLDVPVISVGNLTVGGTGKTPACLWLTQELERRGLKVGVLSRGYRRSGSSTVVLSGTANGTGESQGKVTEAGDEPSMMAGLYGKTVAVASRRYDAGKELLRQHKVDVLVLDDGYQHRKLKRDLDLLVLGADRSGWLLPAGPFRESKSALRRAQVFLVTGAEAAWASRLSGKGRYFVGSLEPKCLIGLDSGRIRQYPLSQLDRSKIVAVAGIANSENFYRMIYEWGGEIVDTLGFPDHHLYHFRDWQRISRAARGADLIITTEKDLLKLVGFPVAKEKLFALRVAMVVENGDALVEHIVNMIEKSPQANSLDSLHAG
ncbi:MAG: tetraacyldisaccharide 4'-kinase [Candidatus Binatia bacterium]